MLSGGGGENPGAAAPGGLAGRLDTTEPVDQHGVVGDGIR